MDGDLGYSTPVKRILVLAVALLSLTLDQTLTAQVRVSQAPGPQTPGGTHVRQRPAPGPPASDRGGFRSRLLLAPPVRARHPLDPFRASRLPFFDLLPFWYWDGATPGASYFTAGTAPDGAPLGGLQLDVQPWRAAVYADGIYVGRVEEFRGYYQHLELGAGAHFVEIVADGYEPLGMEIVIAPGRTITYRATLTRYP